MDEFDELRTSLFAIAYNMLGSVMEAEDIVQDAYVRFQAVDREKVRDMRAFLKSCNMYPSEKCLRLFYQRLDKNEDSVLSYDEFITGLSPMQSNQDV